MVSLRIFGGLIGWTNRDAELKKVLALGRDESTEPGNGGLIGCNVYFRQTFQGVVNMNLAIPVHSRVCGNAWKLNLAPYYQRLWVLVKT
jgi:hypothetical protein